MTDTLIATTARPVTVGNGNGTYETAPAGTTVYATEQRDGTFRIRIPGTLLTQRVYISALLVP